MKLTKFIAAHLLILMTAILKGSEALPPVIKTPDGGEMVLVPAGNFLMGSDKGDEAPIHIRYLAAFYIDRYEVSNAQYARFVEETGYPPPLHWGGKTPPKGEENLPVTNISWYDAMRYAIWAGKRLPTEAEWEKASRGTDGRIFPWGNEDDPERRNLSTDKIQPVDAYPEGSSPYGCFNMAGNVWEWTADWYEAYPSSKERSLHFGKKYKVIRGGGAIEFYPIPNTGHCSQRARLVPYGYYDGLGFRCVKDVNPKEAPYDPIKLLREAEEILNRPLPSPRPLSYEDEYQKYLEKKSIPLRIEGDKGEEGYVRTGIPFPKGFLKEVDRLALFGAEGKRLLQAKAISSWEDGSIAWALLDFPARAGETLDLKIIQEASNFAVLTPFLKKLPQGIIVDLGEGKLFVGKDGQFKLIGGKGEKIIEGIYLSLKTDKGKKDFSPLPPEIWEVEEEGDLHIVIHLKGKFVSEDKFLSPFLYDMRIHCYRRFPRIRVSLTIVNFSPRESEPTLISTADLGFLLAEQISELKVGADGEEIKVNFKNKTELIQENAYCYVVRADEKMIRKGIRGIGCGWVKIGQINLGFTMRYFWQNHPVSLSATGSSVCFGLYRGEEPMEWEGGLAKTYDIYLEFGKEGKATQVAPLVAIIPPAWVAGTKVLDDFLPKGEESLECFPYWEAMLEESMRKWVRGMATGIRDFGDAYYGGPYKGKNSYANLEYDVPFNFLVQFLRTGERWYLDAAEIQARHQSDIDIDHFTGRQWKHSPLHTTTEADLGHVFLKGMLLHYLLTGEKRSLESAEEIGRWLASKVKRFEGITNERQIGWPLYALCALSRVTRKRDYLTPTEKTALKLAREQAPTGRFNIRWDNRIAFFNGIAMSALLEVYKLTNREEIYNAILKLAYRTIGFYPEYACRTLDSLSYLAERTRDTRLWDLIERTWESSMEFLQNRIAFTSGTFSWQFLHFLGKYRLPMILSDNIQKPKLDRKNWHSLRLKGNRLELSYEGNGSIMVILEGLSEGTVVILGGRERFGRKHELKGDEFFKKVVLPLSGRGRVILKSKELALWEIHYDKALKLAIYEPSFSNLPNIYPKAYCNLKEGAEEIKLLLKAQGEGFHKALIYDPNGKLLGAIEKFIDLGDDNSYELELKVSVPKGVSRQNWGLEIYECDILKVEGLSPLITVLSF